MVQPCLLSREKEPLLKSVREPAHGSGPLDVVAIHDDLICRQEDHFFQVFRGPLTDRIKVTNGFNSVSPKFQSNWLGVEGREYINDTTPNRTVPRFFHKRGSQIAIYLKALQQRLSFYFLSDLQVLKGVYQGLFG